MNVLSAIIYKQLWRAARLIKELKLYYRRRRLPDRSSLVERA